MAGVQYQSPILFQEGLGTKELLRLEFAGDVKISANHFHWVGKESFLVLDGKAGILAVWLFQPIIWGLTSNDHVMHVTLAQAGATDADETSFLL